MDTPQSILQTLSGKMKNYGKRTLLPGMLILGFQILALPATANATGLYADIQIRQGDTELGTIKVELFVDKVPRVVANFVGLATGQRPWTDPRSNLLREATPYYDGLTFHRLVRGFVIQGGDPTGTGSSGPGYVFQDQFHPDLTHRSAYYLSMAHSGPNTNGSQFFITLGPAEHLDFLHSVFGKVIEGQSIIDSFGDAGRFPTDANSRPLTPIVMQTVRIHGDALASFDAMDPAHGLPVFRKVKPQLRVEAGDAVQPVLKLAWDRKALVDYPVFGSGDLAEWIHLGNGMSMSDDADFETVISGALGAIADQGREFFYLGACDYGTMPRIPRTLLRAGVVLRLDISGGELELRFSGGESGFGSWQYSRPGESKSGLITDAWESVSDVLPDEGIFIAGGTQSYARRLLVRQVTVFFDKTIGPNNISAIQPTLSFHRHDAGWYDGPYNSEPQIQFYFRDQFRVEWP